MEPSIRDISERMLFMDLFYNVPLWAAISAIFFAQFIKVPLHFIMHRKSDWSLLTSTGGMPSSHSAGVTALATSVAIDTGLGSTLFAVSTMLAVIVMYDATGVRRQAGEHAVILNKLRHDFQKLIADIHERQGMAQKITQEDFKMLKELLGHKPAEVFFGGLTGVIWALILHNILQIL